MEEGGEKEAKEWEVVGWKRGKGETGEFVTVGRLVASAPFFNLIFVWETRYRQ